MCIEVVTMLQVDFTKGCLFKQKCFQRKLRRKQWVHVERDVVGDAAGELLPDRGGMALGAWGLWVAYNRIGTGAGATVTGL